MPSLLMDVTLFTYSVIVIILLNYGEGKFSLCLTKQHAVKSYLWLH